MVQLPPGQNNKHGDGETSIRGNGSIESTDKEAAALLNSAIKKAPDKSTSYLGLTRIAWAWRGQQAQVEDGGKGPQQGPIEEEGQNLPKNQPPLPIERASTPTPPKPKAIPIRKPATPKSVPRPAALPGSATKRKRPTVRPDNYEVWLSPDRPVVEDEELNGRPAKRAKRSTQGKKPIIAPKISKGYYAASSRQNLTLHGESDNGYLGAAAKPPASSRIEVAIPSYSGQTPPAKAKRGRPKKDPQVKISAGVVLEEPQSSEQRLNPAKDGSFALAGDTIEALPGHALPSEGDTSLYLNPSPIKPPQSAIGLPATHPASTKLAGSGSETKAPASKLPSLSPDPESELSNVDDSEDPNENEVDLEPAELETEDVIFDIETLNTMLINSKRVGHEFNKKESEWSLKMKMTTLLTPSGKRIMMRLKRLISEYRVFQNAKETGSSDIALKKKAVIIKSVQKLQAETDLVLTARLGNPSKAIAYFDEASTIRMLKDLYFNVLPYLIETIKTAAEVYTLQYSAETSDIQELFDLADMLCRLAETALRQPDQPVPIKDDGKTALKSESYQISQPTRSIIKDSREFRSALSAELRNRERVEKQAVYKKLESESKRKRQERAQREQVEKCRLAKEIHRVQNQNLAAQLADPLWGDILMAEIMKEEVRGTASSATSTISRSKTIIRRVGNSRSREILYVDDQRADSAFSSDKNLPFDDDHDGYHRVRMFKKNNTRRQSRPKPWTNEEKTQFIDFIRFERGQDRYERVAEMLERSMDDIFSHAKDLQEAMDLAHESGMLNEEVDEWTYDIWIDPKQRD